MLDGLGYDRPSPLVINPQPVPPPRVAITLELDADILDWLHRQPGWKQEIADLLRCYMERQLITELAFEEAAAE